MTGDGTYTKMLYFHSIIPTFINKSLLYLTFISDVVIPFSRYMCQINTGKLELWDENILSFLQFNVCMCEFSTFSDPMRSKKGYLQVVGKLFINHEFFMKNNKLLTIVHVFMF